ncbi:MAG TPA: hypothetical protein VHS09_03580, partial [Polyangiaceae bacterium]|nr:hypothetical protein [Polyangiaceae bacterium]
QDDDAERRARPAMSAAIQLADLPVVVVPFAGGSVELHSDAEAGQVHVLLRGMAPRRAAQSSSTLTLAEARKLAAGLLVAAGGGD